MTEEREVALSAARDSLARIQSFDPASIVLNDKLGAAFDFSPAAGSAREIIGTFNQLDREGLDILPESALQTINSMAVSTQHIFEQCAAFNPTTSDASTTRLNVISSINSHVNTIFNTLSPIISYVGSQNARAKAAADGVIDEILASRDALRSLIADAQVAKQQTSAILETARSTSGKVAVGNEAEYFRAEASVHRTASDDWKTATIWAAIALLGYSVGTAFLHKWDWFMPTTNIGLTQFLVSKILVFGVLGYLLSLSAKNFLNHKHNEIVNKHRQNALLTYEAMVNAGQTDEARNIVLQLAAASIYQLHDTGYVKSSESSGRGGIIEILPKTSIPLSGGSQ